MVATGEVRRHVADADRRADQRARRIPIKADVQRFLRSAQRRPANVARYFQERHVTYAAARTI